MTKKYRTPEQRQQLHRFHWVARVAVVIAFVAVGALTAFTALRANSAVGGAVLADASGSPRQWHVVESSGSSVSASTDVRSQVLGGEYIEYTVQVANATSRAEYITHLASFLSASGNDAGFATISGGALEYSYDPNASSWESIDIALPSGSRNAFRLAKELELGAAGSSTDTVYLRYYVSPIDSPAAVDNKVTVGLRDDSRQVGYSTNTASVAFRSETLDALDASADSAIATTAGDTASADPSSADSSHVAPLGRSSFVPDISAVSTTIATINLNSSSFLTIGVITMVVAVGIFAVCLAVYLPLRKY